MFLIGASILFVVAFLVATPLFKKIPYRPARIAAWVSLLSVLTWPVLLGPMLFKLECAAFTEVNFGPGIDARQTGYLDHRLSDKSLIETHSDQFILDRDVDDLVSGRVAFFEQVTPGGKPLTYVRYSLMDSSSKNCAPRVVGGQNGRSTLPQTAPNKCLGVERTVKSSALYEVSMEGDFNMGVGVSKLVEKSSGKVVGAFRTFGFAFLYSGTTVCPNLNVVGDDYSAHTTFTGLVLKDSLGRVRTALARN